MAGQLAGALGVSHPAIRKHGRIFNTIRKRRLEETTFRAFLGRIRLWKDVGGDCRELLENGSWKIRRRTAPGGEGDCYSAVRKQRLAVGEQPRGRIVGRFLCGIRRWKGVAGKPLEPHRAVRRHGFWQRTEEDFYCCQKATVSSERAAPRRNF